MTATPSNDKEYKAHVRRPRLVVSSRMLRYKTSNGRNTFEKSLGHSDLEQYAIFGKARIRQIIATAMKRLSTVSVPPLLSLRQAVRRVYTVQRIVGYDIKEISRHPKPEMKWISCV